MEALFSDCVGSTGDPYRAAVGAFLAEEGTRPWLEWLARDPLDESPRTRTARILAARLTHPEVFEELLACFGKLRDCGSCPGPCTGECYRPGMFSGSIGVYLRKGPSSRTVTERGEWIQTDHGGEQESIAVERYTDEDVAEGVARNTAASRAVLEYCLKFFDESTAYEQRELLFTLADLWGEGLSLVRRGGEGRKDDLLRAVMLDPARPWPVRITAASLLPKAAGREVVETAFALLRDPAVTDRDRYYRCYHDAGAVVAFRGDEGDLEALRRIEPAEEWRRKLLAGAVEDMLRILGHRRSRSE